MAGLTLGLEVVSGFAEFPAMLVVVGMAPSATPSAGRKAVFAAFHDRPRVMVQAFTRPAYPWVPCCPRLCCQFGRPDLDFRESVPSVLRNYCVSAWRLPPLWDRATSCLLEVHSALDSNRMAGESVRNEH